MKMREIQEAASLVQEQAHDDANIIFGASIDETMGDMLKVTVIATGFGSVAQEIPVEVAREARRNTVSVRETLAPRTQPTPRSETREPVPAFSTRRPASPVQIAAGSRDNQMNLPVRDRIAFPGSSPLDNDDHWDVPAFQRRQNG